MFDFLPFLGEMIQFDEHIFSNGLVQPPTSTRKSWGVMFTISTGSRVLFNNDLSMAHDS